MGSGGAKTTNKMLEAQNQRSRGLQDTATNWANEAHSANRGDIDWARSQYMNLYNNVSKGGVGGGGSPGPAWEDPRGTATILDFMNTGGYSDTDKGNILSYASAPITAMGEELARGLNTQARGSGIGYASGLGRLYRDKAYAGSEIAKGVAGDLAEKILANKYKAALDINQIDAQKRAFLQSRAGAGRAAGERQLSDQERLISKILGLDNGRDLEYYDRALASGGQVYGGIKSREDETPLWQKAVGSILPAAASAAVGAFSPGGISMPKTKKPFDPDAGYTIG